MLPILYNQNETNFKHLGLGVLRDTLSCVVVEEQNGAFELRMTYPLAGTYASMFDNDMIIKTDASYQKKNQLFRIKKITKTKDDVIAIVAYHVSYLTQDLTMSPTLAFSGNGTQVMQQWSDNVIGDDNPFVVSSNVEVVRDLSLRLGEFDNARDVLGKILSTWGGEYYIDNYNIELREQREVHANTLISYGRNMTDLTQEENIANTFTSIQPYALLRDTNDAGNTTKRIVTSIPGVIDSEHTNKFPNRRILSVDFSNQFEREETPTSDRLFELANTYIEDHKIGVPQVSIKVSFVDLSKTLNFKGIANEQLELGDIVPVHFDKLGIRSQAPVNRVTWNVLTESYDSIELGTVKTNLGDAVRDLENGMNAALTRPPVIDGSNMANVTPAPVANLRAVGGFSQIHLFWDFQGIHVDYYEVERSLTTDSGFARVARSRTSTYSDIVDVNQQFFYRVRAVNFHGIAGVWSEVQGAQTANALNIEDHESRLDRVREIVEDWCYDYPDIVTIDGGNIEANTITAREIKVGSITGIEIAGDTIDASHIRAGAITTEHMTAGTISGDIIATGSLSADTIRGGSMSADFIHGGAITGSVFETYNNGARLLRIDNQGLHMSSTNGGTGGLRWTNSTGAFQNVNLSSSGAVNLQVGTIGRTIEFNSNGELRGASLNASELHFGAVPFARLPVGTGSMQVSQGNHTHTTIGGMSFSGNEITRIAPGGAIRLMSGERISLHGTQVRGYAIMNDATTTSSANLNISTGSTRPIRRSTSASRYKLAINRGVEYDYAARLLKIEPANWFDRTNSEHFADVLTQQFNGEDVNINVVEPVKRIPGLVAEDVEAAGLDEFVTYNNDGKTIEGISYDRLWTLLIPLVREQGKQLEELNNELETLKNGK